MSIVPEPGGRLEFSTLELSEKVLSIDFVFCYSAT